MSADMSNEARDRLRAAHGAREAATARVKAILEVVDRGRLAHTTALAALNEAQVAARQEQDRPDTKFIAAIRGDAAASDGGKSAAWAAAQKRVAAAAAREAAARRGLSTLGAALVSAEAAQRQAEDRLIDAIEGGLVSTADNLAAQVEVAELHAARLRASLEAMAEQWLTLPGGRGSRRIQPLRRATKAGHLLQHPRTPELGHWHDDARQGWQAFATALLTNPDAAPDQVEFSLSPARSSVVPRG